MKSSGGIISKINLAFGAALILLLGMFGLTYYNTNELIKITHQVDHSHRILQHLSILSAQLRDVDAHARNYLMIHRKESYEHFENATEAVTREFEALQQLTPTFMAHQIRLNRIKQTLEPRLRQIRLMLVVSRPIFKPTEFVQNPMLRFVWTPDTRELLQAMQKTAMTDLQSQTSKELEGAEYVLYAILLGGILTLAIFGVTVTMIHRHIRDKQSAETQMAQMFQQAKQLVAFSHDLNRHLNLSERLEMFKESMAQLFQADNFSLFLWNSRDQHLKLMLHNHPSSELVAGMTVTPTENSLMYAAFHQQTLIPVAHFSTSGYQRDSGNKNQYHTDRAICVPLIAEQQCLGLLNLSDFPADILKETQLLYVSQVVEHWTLALKNALMHEDLVELSIRDELTGLYNRRYLYQELTHEVARSARYKNPLSLLMFDIDHFKRINDTYGHGAGDQVLQGVAKIIQDALRQTDIACRYGGEEMAVILPNTSEPDAVTLAERMRILLAQHRIAYEAIDLTVTASIGITALHPGDTATLMLNRADQALYEAKAEGRNLCRLAA